MKKLLLLLTGLFITLTLSHAYSVKGKISDASDNTSVIFSHVALLTQDSTFIKGVKSDENGNFELENIEMGSYLLSVSSIGYQTNYHSFVNEETEKYIEITLYPAEITLDEITVSAKQVINKADRKLILPSQLQIENSTDGIDLLRKMQLPRIMVDPMENEISISGNGEVQLRINGVQVTSREINALNPHDIVRIEFHDDPGVRYGEAAAVIDYIVRHKEAGGNVRANLMNNIGKNKTSADDMLAIKYNNKKSEFSANTSYIHRKQDWTREYEETFVFPDYKLHRIEKGEPVTFDKKLILSSLNYSLVEKDNYFFNAQLRHTFQDFPGGADDRKSTILTSDSDIPLYINDHTKEKNNSPVLDLYFQRNVGKGQLLIFNAVGTYIHSRNTRSYQEQRENILETDIYSDISGNKYSIIMEGIYEKNLSNGKLTGGIKHLQAYTDNEYKGVTNTDISMKQAESYIYAEYQIKSGKWGYMANLSANRFYYSQEKTHNEKYSLQPSARITFEPNLHTYLRYRVNLKRITPTLAYLNNVEQVIEPLQIRRGNPNLNSFQVLNQSFNLGYTKDIFAVDLLINYDYQFNPIMESVLYENGIFVRTYENQQSFQELGAELTFKIKPWKDYLSISLTPKVNRYISKGNHYLHTYTMTEIRANVDFTYHHFIANFTTKTPPRSVYGEQLRMNDPMYILAVGYKKKEWAVMAGGANLFIQNYKGKLENWSYLNPVKSEIHTKNMTNIFFVQCSVNLDFGKQFKGAMKRTKNIDNDSGIMSGNK